MLTFLSFQPFVLLIAIYVMAIVKLKKVCHYCPLMSTASTKVLRGVEQSASPLNVRCESVRVCGRNLHRSVSEFVSHDIPIYA
jgi:hypothetical protein